MIYTLVTTYDSYIVYSIVFGMKIVEYCKLYSFVDVNHIYYMSSNMYNNLTLELICAIDDNIGH